jgi:cytidylyltransferase family protein
MDPGRRDPGPRPAPAPRPARSSPIVGVVLLVLALVTTRLGPAGFCAFVCVVSGLGALELATTLKRQGASVKPIVAGAGAAAFAVGAYRWGESAILGMTALLFVAYAGGLAIRSRRGLRPGVVRTMAALLLPAVYAGLAGSFLVLVRRGSEGTAMVEVFVGMIVAYRLGLWAGSRWAGGSRRASMVGMGPGMHPGLPAPGPPARPPPGRGPHARRRRVRRPGRDRRHARRGTLHGPDQR